MEKTYIFKCDDCGNSWSSDQYNEEAEGREGDWATGAECPKCESENIGGTEI